jgi:hypothetical protein
MSVDRPPTAPAATHRPRAAAISFDSRTTAVRPDHDSRAATARPTPAARRTLPRAAVGRPPVAFVPAIDPAATVELSADAVAALIAESAADVTGKPAAPAAAAAGPPALPTRSRMIDSHHRDLLAIAVLWGVLATCLLIVACCYVLSVVAQPSAPGP